MRCTLGGRAAALVASIAVVGFVGIVGGACMAADFTMPRKGQISPILCNTFAYVPEQPKRFLYRGSDVAFQVVQRASGKVAYSGELRSAGGVDLAAPNLLAGDFTSLTAEGEYVIHVGQYESWPFRIAHNAYGSMVHDGLGYLQEVRSGDGVTGFREWTDNVSLLDDGRVGDETAAALGIAGNWWDLVGGWYDASDLRYWTSSWMALEWVAQVAGRVKPDWDNGATLDELKWGNAVFLKTITPDGRVLNPLKADNYWTDNVIGTKDDRIVAEGFVDGGWPFHLAYLELKLARLYRDIDPAYATIMEKAGRRIMDRASDEGVAGLGGTGAVDRGMRCLAYLEMYRLTKAPKWLIMSRSEGRGIIELQETKYIGAQETARGFIYEDESHVATPSLRAHEPFYLMALVELARGDSGDKRWLAALRMYCSDYLVPLSQRNPYHLVPARVMIAGVGGRQLGGGLLSYKLLRTEDDGGNETGINTSILGQASVLMETGKLAHDPALVGLAWEQLNIILGMNPFCSSTIEGSGQVNTRYPGGQGTTGKFPRVPGAVLNGFASNANDNPVLDNDWPSSEYWLPQFGWLGRFLSAAGVDSSISSAPMLPATAVLKSGRSQRLWLGYSPSAARLGDAVWEVNGVPGGNTTLGTLVRAPGGAIYTAPSAPPTPEQAADPKGVLQVVARDSSGAELGRARVRVIPEPGIPGGLVVKATGAGIVVSWQRAQGADTYNVELMDRNEGFWRIYANTAEVTLTVPAESARGHVLRVTAVSHRYGYGTPSESAVVK